MLRDRSSFKLPPRVVKTRLGCQTCRDRHIRCDLSKPECGNCLKRGIKCGGSCLPPRLKWVDKKAPVSGALSLIKYKDSKVVEKTNQVYHEAAPSNMGISSTDNNSSDKRWLPCITKLDDRIPLQQKSLERKETSRITMPEQLLSQRLSERRFLIEHYFTTVASIFTIYDGPENPLGEMLKEFVPNAPLLTVTLLSISAVHLAHSHNDNKMMAYAFEIRSQAVRRFRWQLNHPLQGKEILLTAMMLSMTESYFQPESCGIAFLEAVRHSQALENFSLKKTSYWSLFAWVEMLTSLVSDYDGLSVSMSEIKTKGVRSGLEMDALSGTWVKLFPSIALLTKAIREMQRGDSPPSSKDTIQAIEEFLYAWKTSSPERDDSSDNLEGFPININLHNIKSRSNNTQFLDPASEAGSPYGFSPEPEQETYLNSVNDCRTPEIPLSTLDRHCSYIGNAYRLSGLLQLYHSCPCILEKRISILPVIQQSCAAFMQELADSIIYLLRKLPLTSRLFNVASFPLMTAGQLCTDWEDRQWVLAVIEELQKRNGIAIVSRLAETLQEVWKRRDSGEDVTWMDIFAERKCFMMIN